MNKKAIISALHKLTSTVEAPATLQMESKAFAAWSGIPVKDVASQIKEIEAEGVFVLSLDKPNVLIHVLGSEEDALPVQVVKGKLVVGVDEDEDDDDDDADDDSDEDEDDDDDDYDEDDDEDDDDEDDEDDDEDDE